MQAYKSYILFLCLFLIHEAKASTYNFCQDVFKLPRASLIQAKPTQFISNYNPFVDGINQNIGVSVRYSPSPELVNKAAIQIYKPDNFQQIGSKVRSYRVPYFGLPINFGKYFFHDVGLMAIYQNYGSLVNSDLVKTVIQAEKKLSIDRQETYLISDRLGYLSLIGDGKFRNETVRGFIRLFDGTFYGSKFNGKQNSNPSLPLEIILSMTGKGTNIVQSKRNEGFMVYEIGKYFVEKSLNSQQGGEVRKGLLTWLKDYIQSRPEGSPDQSYFFVHVASKVHRIAYERSFGLKPVSKELSQGLEKDEDILVIRGDELLDRINKIISAP